VSEQKMNPLGWLGIALVVAIVLMAAFAALSLTTDGGYYGMMGTGAWGWGVVMMAVPGVILIVILLAAVGALGERSATGNPAGTAPPVAPLEVLDQRYAQGELNRDEYLRIRTDLTQHPSNP